MKFYFKNKIFINIYEEQNSVICNYDKSKLTRNKIQKFNCRLLTLQLQNSLRGNVNTERYKFPCETLIFRGTHFEYH